MAKAQDNGRETLQKKRFGLTEEHKRDNKFDGFCNGMNIEFKTKARNKACTTKRRYANDPFGNCVLIVTNYDNPKEISDDDWIVFPEALEEWREEQERKLQCDNGTIPCHDEINKIVYLLGDHVKECYDILDKLRNQVHRNDPAIPKRFFDSDGEYTSINQKKTKVKHSEWMFRVPDNVDKASFLREKIDLYKKSKGLLS